jgi:hypothetical protein
MGVARAMGRPPICWPEHNAVSRASLKIQIVQRYTTFSFRGYINSGFSRLFK